MIGPSGFREGRSFQPTRLSRGLSPQVYGYRPSPKLVEALYSPQLSPKFDSYLPNMSDFINSLQDQIKRMTPNFAFRYSSDPPLVQTLAYVAQTIDHLLEERSKYTKNCEFSESQSGLFGEDKEGTEKTIEKVREEMEKVKETTKNLAKYEQLLKKKEEKFEEEKSRFHIEKKKLKDFEEEVRKLQTNFELQEKAWAENKKFEQDRIRSEREEVERKIIESKDMQERLNKKIDETTKHLRYEKEGLLQLEACLNDTKTNLAQEQKRISFEKLEMEKLKWKLDQRERKVDESEIILKMKEDKLEQDKKDIENEKNRLSDLKQKIDDERALSGNESKLSNRKSPDDLFAFEKKSDFFKSINFEQEAKTKELDERENELEQAYRELQEQMDNFNKELEEREIIIEEKENYLSRAEKDLGTKLESLRKLESALTESKLQLEEIRTTTFPELEDQSATMDSLAKDLTLKRNELEITILKLNKEIEYVQRHKSKLDSIYNNAENQKPTHEGLITAHSSEDIEAISQELEKKIHELREREEELSREHEKLQEESSKLQEEKDQLIQTAEFLKKAHMQVEDKKAQYEKEHLDEKERLKAQFMKLENGMRLLTTKEAELQSLKKKVEEREGMLKVKEAEMNKRSAQNNSRTSSMSKN